MQRTRSQHYIHGRRGSNVWDLLHSFFVCVCQSIQEPENCVGRGTVALGPWVIFNIQTLVLIMLGVVLTTRVQMEKNKCY